MSAWTLLGFVGLSALALALLLRPWWRAPAGRALRRREANVAAYRGRLAEIEQEVAAGLLDEPSAAELREELGARLLADAVPDSETATGRGRGLALALALLLPVFAGVWYALQDSWRTQALITLSHENPQEAERLGMQALADELTAQLAREPGDAEAWAMLGRARFVLNQMSAAAEAYARANELSGAQEADWLVGEGETLTLAGERDLQGRPRELFEAALKLAPAHGKALWYAGLAAAQAGDYARARERWQALAAQEIPPELRQLLNRRLQELSALMGEPVFALRLRVSAAPGLALPPQPAVLWVFARAEGGPPMPVAARRIERPQLPLELSLSDADAMLPELRLSQFSRWTLTARLTLGADVEAQPGDVQGGLSVEASAIAQQHQIILNEVLP